MTAAARAGARIPSSMDSLSKKRPRRLGPARRSDCRLLALDGGRHPGQVVLVAVVDERIRLRGIDRGRLRRDFSLARQPRQVVLVAVVVEGGGGSGVYGDSRDRQR